MGVGLRVLSLAWVAPYDIASPAGVVSGHIAMAAGVALRDTALSLGVVLARMGLVMLHTVIVVVLPYVAPCPMVALGRMGFVMSHTALDASHMALVGSAVDVAWVVAHLTHPVQQRGLNLPGYRDIGPLLASTLGVLSLSHMYSPPSSTCLNHPASVLVPQSYLLDMLHLVG